MSRRSSVTGLVVATGLVAAACGGGGDPDAVTEPTEVAPVLTVVADVDPIADLVRVVAGDRARVESLVPTGLDGHTYEPRISDAAVLTAADVFVSNGGDLNVAVEELAEVNLPEGAMTVLLAELTIDEDELLYTDTHSHGGVEHSHGGPNAHLWTNPPYAIRYVAEIEAALTAADAEGADSYAANAAAITATLTGLSEAIAMAIDTIPSDDRMLVVYHDSWSYFGREYDIEVVGAIQPVDFSEPSASEVGEMVDQIKDLGVPAFFGSEVFPSDVLEAIARESGSTYIGDLNDDRMPGEPGDPEHMYVGMMVHNARTIVDALGGDSSSLDPFDVTLSA